MCLLEMQIKLLLLFIGHNYRQELISDRADTEQEGETSNIDVGANIYIDNSHEDALLVFI